MNILGVSAFYHDSAAALIKDGEIIAAVQEERFTRKKYDSSWPLHSIEYCLKTNGLEWNDIDAVVYYDKPWLKFERILETFYAFAPRGSTSFLKGLPIWIKEKALMPRLIRKDVPAQVPLKWSSHHLSHAASAFFPSPFASAAVLTLDGVGEWATTTISRGNGRVLTPLKEICFPHSIGLLYSAFTQFCGFKVNSGEYKLMGLAPYGRRHHPVVQEFKEKIKNTLCHIYEDGGIWLDQSYFSYSTSDEMINHRKWKELFCVPARKAEAKLSQVYCDLALAIQEITEEIVLKLARHAKELTNEKYLCLAGGVALNCVANGALRRERIFEDIWIQPAAGDAGGAIGAALAYYYSYPQHERKNYITDGMKGSFLGPEYVKEEIRPILHNEGIVYQEFDEEDLFSKASELLNEGEILGWFQGRMEFGPRALGSRSILADARSPEMQKKLNLKVKFREGFRPFAPSCLAEDLKKFFTDGIESPYMLLIDHLHPDLRSDLPEGFEEMGIDERLYFTKSKFPAITHLDFSARLQSVHSETNPIYHRLLSSFKKVTGVGLLVNTSFNVRGEPIVCTPEDALKCFFHTEIDSLVLGPFLIRKYDQNANTINSFRSRMTSFVPD